MREIKFRGLRTDGKGWAYGHIRIITVIQGKKHLMSDWFGNDLEVIPETIGQFTGLLDKNGKEIYEGDILKYESHHPKHEGKFFNNVVEFASGQTLVGWRMRNKSTIVRATPFKFMDSEIIGSIHTTPNYLTPQINNYGQRKNLPRPFKVYGGSD